MTENQEAKYKLFMEEYKKQMFDITMESNAWKQHHSRWVDFNDSVKLVEYKQEFWDKSLVNLGSLTDQPIQNFISRCDIKGLALTATLKTFNIKRTYKALNEWFNV